MIGGESLPVQPQPQTVLSRLVRDVPNFTNMPLPGPTNVMGSNPNQPNADTLQSTAAQYVPVRRPTREFQAENPAYKLTVGLLDTYKRINENYYEAKRRRQEQQQQQQQQQAQVEACDDEQNDYIIVPNDMLNSRYRLEKRLGKGSFGQVVLAVDTQSSREVAIKIIKSKRPFTKQAETELRLLKRLNEADSTEKGCVVRMLDTFMHKGHRCIVFEKLSMNLYDLLRSTKFRGVSFDLIRKFARQILIALKLFSQPEVAVIHCDLKPENILLVEPKRTALKVIDFGSSCTTTERPYTYIQSRFYRSPEVMLGCPYTTAIDMWSLGCILLEMHSGEPLFSGQTEKEQMFLLVGSRGMPPEEMLREGKKVSTFFEVQDDLSTNPPTRKWRLKELTDRTPNARALNPLTIEQALGIAEGSPVTAPYLRSHPKRETREKYVEFADLLNRMLCYSPAGRITPAEALLHPFLQQLDSSQGAATSATNPPPPPPSAYPGGGSKGPSRQDPPPKRPFSQ